MTKGGLKITNLAEVMTMFQLVDRGVNRGARDILKHYTEEIQKTARYFAPVDQYRLEKAIKILPYKGNQYMLRAVIHVSGVVNGRSVDEYATIVHEYQWHKRGPLTRMKGPQAGPRYLARAVEKHKKELFEALKESMRKEISRAVARSGVNRIKR